ncbi:MAG: hypothetical protein ABSA47_13165 [Verrucomicrobiota bacterium]
MQENTVLCRNGIDGPEMKRALDVFSIGLLLAAPAAVQAQFNSPAHPGCTDLTRVSISNCLTRIGYGALAQCKAPASAQISDSVTRIGGSVSFSVRFSFHPSNCEKASL